jgi:hypothetical protein
MLPVHAAALASALEAIGRRSGSTPPSPEAVHRAEQLLQVRPQTAMGVRGGAAEIHYVTDGDRQHMVAVYEERGMVGYAECSCGSESVCAHLLAVLAMCGKPLTI